MIGYYGPIVFETSDERIINFSEFTHSVEANYGYHETIGTKPKTEFQNPGLETIEFLVNLNGGFGVKPRDEIEKWSNIVRSGEAHPLVIGGKTFGKNPWICKSISNTWGTVYQDGKLYSAKIEVSLEEYVRL